MTTLYDKATRWRPHFSVRTLVVVMSLGCVYLACWKTTIEFGKADVLEEQRIRPQYGFLYDAKVPCPFIVSLNSHDPDNYLVGNMPIRRYYFAWFCGNVWQIPYSREVRGWRD